MEADKRGEAVGEACLDGEARVRSEIGGASLIGAVLKVSDFPNMHSRHAWESHES